MKSWPLLLVIIGAFLFVEAPGLWHAEPGDEWNYFYMARQLSHGSLPYRDFFFAHPPFQLLLYFLPAQLGMVALKLVPLLCTIGSGILVYLLAGRHGRKAGILAAGLFFSSYAVMLEATYGVGVCEATFLVLLGITLFSKHPVLGGLFLGLAGLTRTYALIPAGLFLAYSFFKERKESLKAAIGFSITYVLPTLILVVCFGSGFIDPVIRYHFLKPHLASNTWAVFKEVCLRNLPLLIASLWALIFSFRRSILPFGAIALASIAFLLSLNRIFNFYFFLAMPFLAIIAGSWLSQLWKGKARFLAFLLIGFSLYFFVTDSIYLRKVDFTGFAASREFSGYLGSGTIFGNDGTASMLAFQNNLEVCGDYIDTNPMRFQSGLSSLDQAIAHMRSCGFVALRPLEGFGSMPGVLEAAQACKLLLRRDDPLLGTFLLYNCQGAKADTII
ncbi:MAG: hypothetical protein V1735_07075 [Nanoarchaeota archaeon]